MYRKVFVAQNADDLNVKLPDDYLHKGIEVIAFEIKESRNEILAAKKEAAKKAHRYFKTIQIDLGGFNFNRDEANER
ncbi:hypothetical protein [Dyadobacter pollutisoli]|jgi:malate synthase|uniref:Uncharacterized protein n=1 Tax=Dyadobacter pollutisoli TaxID=2910158 RepID=A0A9E8NGH9_9BACT|nr:hypothetical protein [Dyadobacter pollutisoli]WAC13842.1 hypothetical protein ON006_07750 [Dyadobacter pollutisoli]